MNFGRYENGRQQTTVQGGKNWIESLSKHQIMRILIDIGHPGHLHLFKHLAHRFIAEGSEVLFTAREKEFELELIRAEGFRYKSFGKHYKTLYGKIGGY